MLAYLNGVGRGNRAVKKKLKKKTDDEETK